MSTLEYDPFIKQQIKDALYHFLYKTVNDHFNKKIKVLIEKNAMLHNSANRAFSYRGVTYNRQAFIPSFRYIDHLHNDLIPEMEDYLSDVALVNSDEIPFVLGYINKVLNSSNYLEDYFRLLPASVHQPLKAIADISLCKNTGLSEDQIQEIIQNNNHSITLMRKRMVFNLLL